MDIPYTICTRSANSLFWHNELFDYANKVGITLFSNPFDETAVDLLESLGSPALDCFCFY